MKKGNHGRGNRGLALALPVVMISLTAIGVLSKFSLQIDGGSQAKEPLPVAPSNSTEPFTFGNYDNEPKKGDQSC